MGLFLKGYFCGTKQNSYTDNDGNTKVSNYVLLTANGDFFQIKTEKDHSKDFIFGDEVTFSVSVGTYKDKLYFTGRVEDLES